MVDVTVLRETRHDQSVYLTTSNAFMRWILFVCTLDKRTLPYSVRFPRARGSRLTANHVYIRATFQLLIREAGQYVAPGFIKGAWRNIGLPPY